MLILNILQRVVVKINYEDPITVSRIKPANSKLSKYLFPLSAYGLTHLPALGVPHICKKTYCYRITCKMKIRNAITPVAKYREHRYQNPEELSEMAKTCTLTFNGKSAANLDLRVMVLHRLTRDISSAEQYHYLSTQLSPESSA